MFSARGGFKFQSAPDYTVPGDYEDDLDTRILLKFNDNFSDTNTSGRSAKSMQTVNSPTRSSSVVRFGSQSLSIVSSTSSLPRVFTTSTRIHFQWWDQDWTVECWFYTTSFADHTFFSGSNLIPKLMGYTASNDYAWAFGALSDARLAWWYWNGSGQTVVSDATLSTNTWHHIMMDHRFSDGRIRLGIDGQFVKTGSRIGSPVGANEFSVGSVRLNSPQYNCDNLRISHLLRY